MTTVRILVNKPWSGRPKPNMVRVGRCVLVHRSASGWRHMSVSPKKTATKMCSHPEHWDFNAKKAFSAEAIELDFDAKKVDHSEAYGLETIVAVTYQPSAAAKKFAEAVGAELDAIIAAAPALRSPIIGEVIYAAPSPHPAEVA